MVGRYAAVCAKIRSFVSVTCPQVATTAEGILQTIKPVKGRFYSFRLAGDQLVVMEVCWALVKAWAVSERDKFSGKTIVPTHAHVSPCCVFTHALVHTRIHVHTCIPIQLVNVTAHPS